MEAMPRKRSRGVTLIEVMVAVLAVIVIVIGAMNFQYYCARDARMADARAMAVRLGLLLLEDWRVDQGVDSYDPQSASPVPPWTEFDDDGGDPGLPGLAYVLGDDCYLIRLGGVYYFVKLSYQDDDPEAPRRLRTLNATIAWLPDFGSSTENFSNRSVKPFVRLTKYTIFDL